MKTEKVEAYISDLSFPQDLDKLKKMADDDKPEGTHNFIVSATMFYKLTKALMEKIEGSIGYE